MAEAEPTGPSDDAESPGEAAVARELEAAAAGSVPAGGLAPAAIDRLTERVYELLRDDLRRQRERSGIGRWR